MYPANLNHSIYPKAFEVFCFWYIIVVLAESENEFSLSARLRL